ncbi:hypothetical protein DDP54_15600 (plasmid) [Cellulomonas sp. WB94]|uniref:DNA polymerase III subunit beta n=1 Tax=Cellulomonas sp. WB94 TaxID=2173174 RepID=UPI000D57DBBD|nr:DNA polymerase III subunit beta [Cellulomonas sp. WB94]PVU81324.1 hypothetical protein DDP54_15600 [Cellulomonas sp. WB94]
MTATLEAPAVTTTARVSLLDLDRAAKLLRVTLPSRPIARETGGIRVTGRAGVVSLESFDYATGGRVLSRMDGDDFGPVVLEGRALLDAFKAAGLGVRAVARVTADVTLTVPADGPVQVHGPNGAQPTVARMHIDPDNLPDLPAVVGPSVTVDGDKLTRAAGAVAAGASRDVTLPLLSGARVTFTADTVQMVTTDRYRLHEATVPASPMSTADLPADVLLPAVLLHKLVKLVPAGEDVTVVVSVRDTRDVWARLSWPGADVLLLSIDGDYPAVDRLWPDNPPHTAVVDRAALLAAVKTVQPFCERNMPVRLDFGIDCLTVHNGDTEAPMSAAPVQAGVQVDGMDGVAFNPSFLVDALEALDGPTVTLHMSDQVRQGAAFVLKPVEFTDGGPARVLLVPIRFGG